MLPRAYRLPATVSLVHARFGKSNLFSVKYASNDLPESRFAFVVRKSIDKRAVIRNRVRRVFRSCIEQMREHLVPGYDMLFFLEKGIIDKHQTEICQELQSFFREKNLIK